MPYFKFRLKITMRTLAQDSRKFELGFSPKGSGIASHNTARHLPIVVNVV
jgi:hypothetical protein